MVTTVFATKVGMSQAWTTAGKRLPVTKCRVQNNVVVRSQADDQKRTILEIGFGHKKIANMKKPLRSTLEKGGFSIGIAGMAGVRVSNEENAADLVGTNIQVQDVLQVGDVVKVQGTTKGRGFAGAIKRHGFHGGPKTHGQSDRERSVGSIGAGTSPGRVWKGKKMPGHYGVETKTVKNLLVVHIDEANQEVWLSGPVPGSITSIVRIEKLGENKSIELDKNASGIVVSAQALEADQAVTTEAQETQATQATQATE